MTLNATRLVSSTLVLGLGLLTTLGCSSDSVQTAWSKNMRELGIVPIYPPREDVMVGDVYAYKYDPEAEDRFWFGSDDENRRLAGMSPRLTRIDLQSAAHVEYEHTPSFPQTTDEYESILDGSSIESARRTFLAAKADVAATKQIFQQAEAAIAANPADTTLQQARNKAQEDYETNLDALILAGARLASIQSALQAVDTARTNFDTTKSTLATAERTLAGSNTQANRDARDAAEADLDTKSSVLVAATSKLAQMVGSESRTLYRQPTSPDHSVFTAGAAPADAKKARVNRLRLVAFPDFATASSTSSGIEGVIPLEAFTASAKLNVNAVERVSVSVPAAESYSVPVAEVLASPQTQDVLDWNNATSAEVKLQNDFARAAVLMTGGNDGEPFYYVRLITEVYYARAIDVSIYSSRELLTEAEVKANQPAAAGEPVETVPVAGGSVEIRSTSQRSIGLRRVFDRPVAIGFRGLTFKVNRNSGIAQLGMPSSSHVPTLHGFEFGG